MKLLISCLAVLVAAFSISGQVKATLISGPDVIDAPKYVTDRFPGAESEHQQAFNEQQGVLLTADLGIDGGVISAGTQVDSHMIFLNTPGEDHTYEQGIVWGFDGLVLGIMSDESGMLEAASNHILGAVGTIYPGSFPYRGLEADGDPFDSYSVFGNTITMSMHVTEPGDWVRVVTETDPNPNVNPEPTTLLMLGSGLAGFIGYSRFRSSRRKKK